MLPRPHPAVEYSTVSEGAVLLHVETEVYYGLNTVGARVWELLPEYEALPELCARLSEEYPDAAPGEIERDVAELLELLEEAELVVQP